MKDHQIAEVIRLLEQRLQETGLPIVSQLAREPCDPYLILISTLLSLRTKDEVTAEASERLFALARTPQTMLCLSEDTVARAIYPVGFYHTKARTVLDVSRLLVDRYQGQVPDDLEALLAIKGVGRKTANLVLTLGFDKAGICVDTHVHRISNRLGYVRTRTPDETEFVLRKKLPPVFWKGYNTLLVAFGRDTCRPLSPLCSRCPLTALCDRVGVVKSR